MGPEKLVQRGSVYGFGAGIVTTGVVVLVAGLFDAVLAVVLLVLIAIAVPALALLLGLPEGDPALRVRRWVPVETANPVESGSSMSPADMENSRASNAIRICDVLHGIRRYRSGHTRPF